MVRRGEATFRVDADVRGAVAQLGRLKNEAREVVRDLNRASGGTLGLAGRGVRGGFRAGRAAGGTVAAGFGLQAGFAVFEQLIERLFELFEGTDILEVFNQAFKELFVAIAPVVGVLLEALTPVVKALTPAFVAIARAITPLIELLGGGLLFVVEALTPLIELLAGWFEFLANLLQDVVFGVLRTIANVLNAFGANITLPEAAGGDSFNRAAGQLADVERRRLEEERSRVQGELDRLNSRNRTGMQEPGTIEERLRLNQELARLSDELAANTERQRIMQEQMTEEVVRENQRSFSQRGFNRRTVINNEIQIDGEVITRQNYRTRQVQLEGGVE